MPSDQMIRPLSLRLPYGAYPARQYFDGDTDPTETVVVATTTTTSPGDPSTLGDAGKAAIDKERTERRAAEKRAKDAEAERDQLKADQQKRETEEAERQGNWQKLAEERQAEIDRIKADAETEVATAKAEIARRDRDDRARVALKAAGLDESLLDRIRGDTAEELKADADKLFKLVKASAPKSPGNNPDNPPVTGGAGDKVVADATELARQRYGLPAHR